MKRFLIAIAVLAVLAVLVLGGVLAFRHFVTDRIMDGDGMEDPNFAGDPEGLQMLDGDFTYVDNGALLKVIAGTWSSAEGRYGLTIDGDFCVSITMDGETVLKDQISFIYLQPGYVQSTEFSLDSWELQSGDGEIRSFYHEAGDDSGRIFLELSFPDGSSETIEFQKTQW